LLSYLQTATTRRKAVSTRRILALLVVLALSLGLCSIPAGSATLQRTSATGDVASVTTYRDGDGDGEDIDGGDDDRWGNLTPPDNGGEGGDPEAGGGDEEEGNGEMGTDRILGRVNVLQIGIRSLFGFLVIVL
jgi:hypothetical protein